MGNVARPLVRLCSHPLGDRLHEIGVAEQNSLHAVIDRITVASRANGTALPVISQGSRVTAPATVVG